jgi:hydrogenase maturation protein HypF
MIGDHELWFGEMTSDDSNTCVARRVTIQGVVQGVGFRSFVCRLAACHRVAGWVRNNESGVEIHAEAVPAEMEAFLNRLRSEPPPAAQITSMEVDDVAPENIRVFQILASRREATLTVRISPDLAVCDDCLSEMFDPVNRRFRYPYINCSHCGPRYSIIRRLPYDRPGTTMTDWEMCSDCRQEYDDPLNRRHHAQPIACPNCGPGFRLIEGEQRVESSEMAIRRAAELLREGKIVALKGLGGYHLACDASNPETVCQLRERKFRKERPFALLVRNLEEAREIVELTSVHEQLLMSVSKPIVLAPAKIELAGVAPDNDSFGVMLPSTPLHYLLLDEGAPTPLVLTSGNRSNEPIAYRDDDANERLSGIADALLVGERPIARRVDDSIVAVRANKTFMIRRARGYAPGAVCRLPTSVPILALGSDLKNAIAVVVGGQVFVSQHIGDLGDCETDISFENTVRDLIAMYEIPLSELVVAHDLHPRFRSTRFAENLPVLRRIAVQHHHAHIASVLAEHDLSTDRVVGVGFDGFGYGIDGMIWGGDFFVGSVCDGFHRVKSLRPARIPGGDAAARFPAQAAAGFLFELVSLPDLTKPPFCFPKRFADAERIVQKNVRCFASTSMGRLFDTVAALVGFVQETTFEGQAAIWLEHQARLCPPQSGYPFPDFDYRPLLKAVINDRLVGRSVPEIAASFHQALSTATVDQILKSCRTESVRNVVLSGGVFQNEILLVSILNELEKFSDIRVLINQHVPTNDGGICVGQAALAAASLSR